MSGWSRAESLHEAGEILREVRARFETGPVAYGPYLFADVPEITEAEEQAAIDDGLIQPSRVQYAARPR